MTSVWGISFDATPISGRRGGVREDGQAVRGPRARGVPGPRLRHQGRQARVLPALPRGARPPAAVAAAGPGRRRGRSSTGTTATSSPRCCARSSGAARAGTCYPGSSADRDAARRADRRGVGAARRRVRPGRERDPAREHRLHEGVVPGDRGVRRTPRPRSLRAVARPRPDVAERAERRQVRRVPVPSDAAAGHLAAHPLRWRCTNRPAADTLAWAPHLTAIDVLPNTFVHRARPSAPATRISAAQHGIPADAPLIARCTRIIRQKRIDRELHLLAGIPEAYLFVAGDPDESPAEFRRLTALAARLGVSRPRGVRRPARPARRRPGATACATCSRTRRSCRS